MAHRASNRTAGAGLLRRALLAGVLLAVVHASAGCRRTPIGKDCPRQTLPEAALVAGERLGGITGMRMRRTVYLDGRVVDEDLRRAEPVPVTIVVTRERIAQLEADLARTGVFDVSEGCWETSTPIPDGASGALVLRRDGRVRSYSGVDMPGGVERALRLLDAFDDELRVAAERAAADGGTPIGGAPIRP
ncbi:MAG: hypothetical protein KF764_07575 [Labilithrix sp.]|nr:hypothetical protein [Labilithrix sp.]MBX3220295.1 hypothetical protein [Labilithrix sp.]